MVELVLLVASIALADSLNPTTIGPALLLAAGRRPGRALVGFTAAVFVTSFAAGALLVFGPGQALLALVPHPHRQLRRVIEVLGGVLLLLVAGGLWFGRHKLAKHTRIPEPGGRSAVALGAGIMAVELPTAIPYFAAIAAIVGSGFSVLPRLVLVGVFNLIFVLPLIAILAVRLLAGKRAEPLLDRLGAWVPRRAPVILGAFLAIIGLVLLGVGGAGLARHR